MNFAVPKEINQIRQPALTENPLVSVLIVNYNYERFLGHAIQSVLAQTYQRFELVICDDGSTDGSRAVIEANARSDTRIARVFKQNERVAAALNAAYAVSTGEIICFLDADDLFAPQKLERVVETFLESEQTGMVLNILVKIDATGNHIGSMPEFGQYDRGDLRTSILKSAGSFSAAPASGISIRRACAEKIFPIPSPEFSTEADAYIRTVAALFWPVEVINEPLTSYRLHASNVTASQKIDLAWCERGIDAAKRIYRVLQELARVQSWKLAPIEANSLYSELVLLRDYLSGASRHTLKCDARNLGAAAKENIGQDRLAVRRKAQLLGLTCRLPLSFGRPIIEQIYLPTKIKTMVATLRRLLGIQ